MNIRYISLVLVSIASIAGAVAYIVGAVKNEEISRLAVEKAAADEAKAVEERRKSEAEAAAKRDELKKSESEERALADEKEIKKIEAEKAEKDRETARLELEAKEAAAAAAKLLAAAAADEKAAAQAREKTAQDEKAKALSLEKAAAARAQEKENSLMEEKLKSEKVIAERDLLKLRLLDFESAETELREWQHDLEERERALKPEKTVADLSWAGGVDDKYIAPDGKLKTRKKTVYRAEDDETLPPARRELSRVERVLEESRRTSLGSARSNSVEALRKLSEEAAKQGRVIEAQFYADSIETIFPGHGNGK